MVAYQIPPDTRAVGTADPPGDMNNVADMLGLIAAVLAQLAGAGTNADPTSNATNVAAAVALRTAQALNPGASGTVLTSNGASANPTFQQAFVVPTGVKTSNYTAQPGDLVVCDTSGGGFTVTLPNAPPGLTPVTVAVINGTNVLTIAAAGSDVFDKAGGATTKTLIYPSQSSELQYRASGGIWYRKGGHLPLSSLDTRYVLAPQNYAGIFGDGSDGAVNFDGTTTVLGLAPSAGVYTLTRDIFCTTLQIGGGGTATTVIPNGWRIFHTGTATIAANGTISAVGNAAATLSNNHGAGGAMGTGTLGGGRPGSAGVATGAAGQGTAAAGVGTGAPGAGGNGSTGTGGASVGTAPSTGVGWLRTPYAVLATAIFNSTGVNRVDGGGGGSGGGGDGTNFGGGGGSGGGVVAMCGAALVNNGGITAAGGAGGSPSTVVTNGGCGGGGGGAGGLVLTYTLSAVTGSGTASAAGGTGGTKVTNGSGTAANGSNGAAGNVIQITLA